MRMSYMTPNGRFYVRVNLTCKPHVHWVLACYFKVLLLNMLSDFVGLL